MGFQLPTSTGARRISEPSTVWLHLSRLCLVFCLQNAAPQSSPGTYSLGLADLSEVGPFLSVVGVYEFT